MIQNYLQGISLTIVGVLNIHVQEIQLHLVSEGHDQIPDAKSIVGIILGIVRTLN